MTFLNFTSLLAFIIALSLSGNGAMAIEPKTETNTNPDSLPKFDDSFYMTKICRSFKIMNTMEVCDDGYVLKIEKHANGSTVETIVMDDTFYSL